MGYNNSFYYFILLLIILFIICASCIIHINNSKLISNSPIKAMQIETAYADVEDADDEDIYYDDVMEACDYDVVEYTETYIATMDMSHYTNETGSHVPKYEGGSKDRKGNPLVPYESIAIPKKLYSQLPYGTDIKLVTPDGEVYYGRAVDTGSALNKLNRIDRCVSSFKEASNLGVIKNVDIYKITYIS